MKKREISHIEELIKKADFQDNSNAYDLIYKKLLAMDNKYPSDYLLEYYKGLVCYSNPDREKFRTKWAMTFFEKSLNSEPDYIMAKIYLGYCHYDLGEYIKALEQFKSVLSKTENLIFFIKNDQSWRLVNIAEMVAVCYLKLNRLSKFDFFYQSWKDLYYKYAGSDE